MQASNESFRTVADLYFYRSHSTTTILIFPREGLKKKKINLSEQESRFVCVL